MSEKKVRSFDRPLVFLPGERPFIAKDEAEARAVVAGLPEVQRFTIDVPREQWVDRLSAYARLVPDKASVLDAIRLRYPQFGEDEEYSIRMEPDNVAMTAADIEAVET